MSLPAAPAQSESSSLIFAVLSVLGPKSCAATRRIRDRSASRGSAKNNRWAKFMLLFAFSSYAELARKLQAILPLQTGEFSVSRFANDELCVKVQGRVSGEHCLALGSITPPDENLLSFALLAHTLRKEGATKVTAVLPYLAYSRQDKEKPGESLGTAWVGSFLKSSGIDQVITIDVHSERDKELFPLPLVSLSTTRLFADILKKEVLTGATVVAPDNGAIRRCEEVKNAAGIPPCATPFFEKRRTEKRIIHHGPIGSVGRRVVIIDDMIDTGGTLVSACEKLKAAGVEEICILVTHGLFTGSQWTALWSFGIKRIFCTDSVPLRAGFDATNVSVVSIVPLLAEGLSAMGKESQQTRAAG
jgi:ribose-phosphate pyrophosphokinase